MSEQEGEKKEDEQTNESTNFKVVILGSTGVGKTCIVNQYLKGEFDENSVTTNGSSYSTKEIIVDDQKIILDIWDTAGQEKYKSLTKYFYKDSKIAIMVYDISEKSTFDELKNFWLGQIQEYGAKDTIFWVIGNKSDLYIQEEVSENEGKQFAESIGASFKQTSAKNNLGIKDLFQEIGEACVKSRKGERRKTIKLNKKDYEEPQEEVEEKKEKKKKKCCNGH